MSLRNRNSCKAAAAQSRRVRQKSEAARPAHARSVPVTLKAVKHLFRPDTPRTISTSLYGGVAGTAPPGHRRSPSGGRNGLPIVPPRPSREAVGRNRFCMFFREEVTAQGPGAARCSTARRSFQHHLICAEADSVTGIAAVADRFRAKPNRGRRQLLDRESIGYAFNGNGGGFEDGERPMDRDAGWSSN